MAQRVAGEWVGDVRAMLAETIVMRPRFFVFITLLWLCHPQLWSQQLTNGLPAAGETAAAQEKSRQSRGQEPGANVAVAELLEAPPEGDLVRLEADRQVKEKNIVTLSGNVIVHYKDYVVRSEALTYDVNTSEVISPGHLELEGGADGEHISAEHGEMNLEKQTGRFTTVVGTVWSLTPAKGNAAPVVTPGNGGTPGNAGTPGKPAGRAVYASANPFLFTGREVIKDGPSAYTIVDGTVTNCALPHPHWEFEMQRAVIQGGTAKMYDSKFKLLQVPVFYFPYATHAVDENGRQSGLLLPTVGKSSTKGYIIGEEYYWAIDRSMDLLLGMDYFTLRGPYELGQFRYKGRGNNFAQARFTALQDNGGQPGTGINQGGADIGFTGRYDFNPESRAVADLEYLSSYIYREAFAENFSAAVASEVKSTAYGTREANGYAATAYFDRYENFESTTSGDEIKILHVPSFSGEAMDHSLGSYGAAWGGFVTAAGLKRSEPGFSSGGVVERLDFYPHVNWALHWQGWEIRPELALRDTFYSRSQEAQGLATIGSGNVPVERDATLNRAEGEMGVEIRPPAIERTWGGGGGGGDGSGTGDWSWRHVIEPEIHYRYVGGIDEFLNVLRFDETDIVSNTNELEYGLTQRLFVKHRKMRPCRAGEMAKKGETLCLGKSQEAVTWFVGQKYFFNPDFSGAVVYGRRNVLATTIDFSGVAYLTGPRTVSPVISRLHWRSTEKMDVEWDVDYDTRTGALLSSNVFADYHQGDWFAGVSHARLLEPGESGQIAALIPTAHFNQIKMLLGYGGPTKRGFSMATNAGYDIDLGAVQYGAVQTSYNWNCCGLSVEYRRFALGEVRNENQYTFNLTLAGVGTAGNLKRAERLF
jgi:LPS-assembly protein